MLWIGDYHEKKLKSILLLLTVMTAICVFVGCGDEQQDIGVPQTEQTTGHLEQSANANGVDDVTDETNVTDGGTEEQNSQDEPVQNESVDESSDESTDERQDPATSMGSTEELSVHVESVGDNSVVGNKIFIEPGIVEGSEIAVVGIGVDNKALLSVYFDDNASYVYQIIRDGGANVETYDGSFSDIKEGFILNMTGRYEGEDFWAEEVEINDVR